MDVGSLCNGNDGRRAWLAWVGWEIIRQGVNERFGCCFETGEAVVGLGRALMICGLA